MRSLMALLTSALFVATPVGAADNKSSPCYVALKQDQKALLGDKKIQDVSLTPDLRAKYIALFRRYQECRIEKGEMDDD